jgi:hypothetical protein
MTARHILSRWERMEPMLTARTLRCKEGTLTFQPLKLWMVMLYVSSNPISAPELVHKIGCGLSHASGMLRLLHQNELIVLAGKDQTRHRPRTLCQATPKLLASLGLESVTTERSAV